MNKFWNWLRDEATGERILRLDGVISDSTWLGDEVTPQNFRDELNAGEGDVTVWLNSEGGDVFAAVEIYNMLKEYRGRVTIKISALAASAASVIAMAGDEVQISNAGMIMIHNPWTVTQGDSAEMTSTAKMLDGVKESIINAYEQKTHLPREEISRLMDEETWLPANKAVELGFADKILYSEESTTPQAYSRRRVMNCAADAFKAHLAADNQPADKRGKKIAALRRRLNLIGGLNYGTSGTLRRNATTD